MPGRVNILSTPSPLPEHHVLGNANHGRRLEPAVAAADKLLFPPRWR